MDNKIILVFGILVFYVFFGLIYLAIGNSLSEFNNSENLPELTERGYNNPAVNDETNTLFGFIVSGINGYDESENLAWINYFFILITAMLIFTIVIVILHG